MPGTSSEKDTTSHTTTDPWAPQASALKSAFADAQTAYGKASNAVAPTDFTAQMTPAQLATFQQMIQQGGNMSIPGQDAATGTAMQNAGSSGVAGALTGLAGYNPAAANNTANLVASARQYVDGQNIPAQVQAAMQGATETARDVTMPGIEQNAAIGGNTNSTRTGIAEGLVQRGLAEQSANLNGALSGQAYSQGLNLAQTQANNNNTERLAALTNAGSIGNTATNSGTAANASSIANQGALNSTAVAGGAGQQASQQAYLDNLLKQYQAGVSSPYAPVQGLMSVIGTNNWGSTADGTKQETSSPSAWDTISGLMSSAGKGASGMAALMPFLGSDRRHKTHITRIGTLDNGLPLYTFVYKDDPEQRMNIGLMAQDVELVNPAAVLDLNGVKLVNYAMACS